MEGAAAHGLLGLPLDLVLPLMLQLVFVVLLELNNTSQCILADQGVYS